MFLNFFFAACLAGCSQTRTLPLSDTAIGQEEASLSKPLGNVELVIAESAPEHSQQLSINVQNFTSTEKNAKETSKFGQWVFEEITKTDTGDFQAWIEDLKPTLYLNLTTFVDELAKAFTNGLEGVWEYLKVNLRKHNLSKLPA